MSLKAFHIVFVVISTMLTLSFGAWSIREFRAAGDMAFLVSGVFSFVLTVALLIYGRWFLRKLQGIGYL